MDAGRLPPLIADREVWVPPSLSADLETCVAEIAALDHSHGTQLEALQTLLLRTESVASSRIEQIDASVDDYARALHGSRSNSAATSMAAATEALETLIRSAGAGAPIGKGSILAAHRALMADDPHAGRFRDMQNWIGGSDYSPRNALYVPPPPETVHEYLDDLITFANRDDIPVLVQAAVVHAQFESIHPFTDGNGRIGRALINTVFRRRGTTRTVVVPLASALVARRDDYFDVLTAYREGHVSPIIRGFSRAAIIAARESRVTATRLAELPGTWQRQVGARQGSAAARLLAGLVVTPIFSAAEGARLTAGSASSAYAAIADLHAAGVIRPLTNRTRDQVWGAADVLDELDDLGARIGAAASASL